MRAPIAKGEGGRQIALAAAGLIGAILGGGHRTIAIARVVIGGAPGPDQHLPHRAPVRHRHRLIHTPARLRPGPARVDQLLCGSATRADARRRARPPDLTTIARRTARDRGAVG